MASRLDVEKMVEKFMGDSAWMFGHCIVDTASLIAFARTVGRACAREAIGRVYGPMSEHQIRALAHNQRWHARGRQTAAAEIRRALRPRRGKADG